MYNKRYATLKPNSVTINDHHTVRGIPLYQRDSTDWHYQVFMEMRTLHDDRCHACTTSLTFGDSVEPVDEPIFPVKNQNIHHKHCVLLSCKK